ncbi:hypothetical protein Tco_1188159 [Tanacetum coccineum]
MASKARKLEWTGTKHRTRESSENFGSILQTITSTDIAKVSRKRSKPVKHGHENVRAHKEPGECYQKSTQVNLQVYMSPSTFIGGDPRKNDTVDMKEAQPVTITDCHTSNPCELEIDLTAKSSSPIIEGMYGQDWKERAET